MRCDKCQRIDNYAKEGDPCDMLQPAGHSCEGYFRPDKGYTHVPGFQFLAAAPKGERIVSMVLHKDRVFIATADGVYELIDEKLGPVEMTFKEDAGGV